MCPAEEWPLAVERLLGLRSVAVMTFNDHLNMRKLMAPAFTPQALARGVPRLVELAHEHCERWSRQEDLQGVQAIKAYTFHVRLQEKLVQQSGKTQAHGYKYVHLP